MKILTLQKTKRKKSILYKPLSYILLCWISLCCLDANAKTIELKMVNNDHSESSIFISDDCDNATDGGQIQGDEVGCNDPFFDPSLITSVVMPSGGTGALEFIWISTTDNPDNDFVIWVPIPGSTDPFYDPGPITQTTYYMRCARRAGCIDYVAESNPVEKKIQCCENITNGGIVLENQDGCGPVYDPTVLTNLIAPSGGAGDIEYLWFESTVGPPFLPDSPDWTEIPNSNSPEYDPPAITQMTYFIRCARRAGCTTYAGESNIIIITVQPGPELDNIITTVPTCNGMSDGQIAVEVSGENGPYTYEWSNGGANSSHLTDLEAGVYGLTVTNNLDCSNEFAINLPDSPVMTVEIENSPIDCGGIMGIATASVTGGIAPYTYLWSDDNAQTTATATGLSVGNYFVLVTDANGCIITEETSIQNEGDLSINVTPSPVQCAGDNNGSITASPNGGMPPYIYEWNNGENTATINNLAAGTYALMVTDQNDCSISMTVTVNEPDELSLDMNTEIATCIGANDGLGRVIVSGGTLPYTYQWNDAANQTSATASNLAVGTYMVTVTDANNCSSIETVEIEATAGFEILFNKIDVNCTNGTLGSATANPNNGTAPYTYQWNDPDMQMTDRIENLDVGTYSVVVTDANGCTQTADVTIEMTGQLDLSISKNDLSCSDENDGAATVTVNNGIAPLEYEWSNAATTASIGDLTTGTYTVTVTDANNCTGIETVTINAATAVVLNVTTIDATCETLTGAASVQVINGTAPYSYAWNDANNQTTATASHLPTGTYTVIVTDANNCTAEAMATINLSSELDVSISNTSLVCTGEQTATATVTVNTGTAPFTYQWNDVNMQTMATATDLGLGTYNVTVTDNSGCQVIASVTIAADTDLEIDFDVTNSTCHENLDGSITTTVTGGTAPYTYLWENGATTANLTGLFPGNYDLTVTDANGCEVVETATVNKPPALESSISSTNINCSMMSSGGTAAVTVTGGTMPYTYVWDDANAQTTATVSNLSVGTYTVVVTDANGCMLSNMVTIEGIGDFVVIFDINNNDCADNQGASITANPSGGFGPYTYLWSTSETTQSITGLTPGNYEATVTDSNGCQVIASGTVEEMNALQLTLSGANVNCTDGTLGTAIASVTGGTAPYTYLWDDANEQTTATASDLMVGIYTIVVTDVNGCSVSSMITIEAVGDFDIDFESTNNACSDTQNGLITAVPRGGFTPYTYLWSTGATTATITGLATGNYEVTIMDSNGCEVTGTGTINEADALQLTLSGANINCTTGTLGTATATVMGGTAPYAYAWDDANTQTTATATGLETGTYTVMVTDVNGCTVSSMITIETVGNFEVDIIRSNLSCPNNNDGTAQTIINGGDAPYTYEWNTGATTADLMNLSAGTYTITVTDAKACTGIANTTITSPNDLEVTVDATDASCNNVAGQATASATGGTAPYTYFWSDPNMQTTATASNLDPGTYTVIVTDANDCTTSTEVTIGLSGALNVAINTNSNSICEGGVIQLSTNLTGGQYSYAWSATGGNFDNSTAANPTYTMMTSGTYTISVQISDGQGCQGEASIEVTVNPQSSINISPNNTGICSGNTVAFRTVPELANHTYIWTASAGSFDNASSSAPYYTMMTPGTYMIGVTVTSPDGCTATASTTVTVNENPTCSASIDAPISVRGGADGRASVGVSEGTSPYRFEWSNGALTQNITGLGAGTYTVTVTDALGCFCTSSVVLNNPAKLGNFVWEDRDRDGIQDVNEPGIPNVQVILTGTDIFNNPVMDTLLTDASGMYMFDGLEAGTYKVTFETPDDYTASDVNQGNDEALDSDADPMTGMTETVDLDYGAYNPDLDAGFYSNTVNIGDYVWFDIDRDGIQDSNEGGVQDVQVFLIDLGPDQTYGTNDDLTIMSTFTDFSGHYLFTDVPPGKYVIQFHPFSLPNGSIFTLANQGGNDALDSDAGEEGITQMFMVMEDQMDDLTFDAGIYQKCDNITDGGEIDGNEFVCGAGGDPSLITNIELPSGGFGAIEYLWMVSTSSPVFNGQDDPNWEIIPGATGPEYDPSPIFSTTYYARCSRRECCITYFEAEIVTKYVSSFPTANIEDGASNICTDENATYTATFVGNSTAYSWNFGADAIPATYEGRIAPDVSWTSPGTKTITLTTNMNACEASTTMEVQVTNCFVPLGQFDGLSGEVMDEAYVMLNWKTTAEPFDSRFIIERADITQEKFYTLDLMKGDGGEDTNAYELKDASPLLGHNIYRIKHMDINGDYVFSETVSIYWQPSTVKDVHVFPNPFREKTTLQVLSPLEEEGTIQIVSAYGQVLEILPLATDTHQMDLDFSDYPKGLYVVYICYNKYKKIAYRLLKTDDK